VRRIALSELSDTGSTPIPGDVVPPKFTQLLKDIEGAEGEMARFDCRVIGHPTPTIKWYRGRNLIQNSADFQVRRRRVWNDGARCMIDRSID